VTIGADETPAREITVSTAIRRWVQTHRYRETVRQLRALAPSELRSLGISPNQIESLALRASQF
jgi:uncharacterized protein YjiS (DUF1127 family)